MFAAIRGSESEISEFKGSAAPCLPEPVDEAFHVGGDGAPEFIAHGRGGGGVLSVMAIGGSRLEFADHGMGLASGPTVSLFAYAGEIAETVTEFDSWAVVIAGME